MRVHQTFSERDRTHKVHHEMLHMQVLGRIAHILESIWSCMTPKRFDVSMAKSEQF